MGGEGRRVVMIEPKLMGWLRKRMLDRVVLTSAIAVLVSPAKKGRGGGERGGGRRKRQAWREKEIETLVGRFQ